MPPVQRTSMKLGPLALVVFLALAGCRGDNADAAAPADVRDTENNAEPLASGRYDCVADSEGDGWECSESG